MRTQFTETWQYLRHHEQPSITRPWIKRSYPRIELVWSNGNTRRCHHPHQLPEGCWWCKINHQQQVSNHLQKILSYYYKSRLHVLYLKHIMLPQGFLGIISLACFWHSLNSQCFLLFSYCQPILRLVTGRRPTWDWRWTWRR